MPSRLRSTPLAGSRYGSPAAVQRGHLCRARMVFLRIWRRAACSVPGLSDVEKRLPCSANTERAISDACHDRRLRVPARCDRGERGYWRALGQVAVGRRDPIWRMIAEQADGAHRLLTSWRSGSWHGPGGRGARQPGVMPRIARLGPRASQVQPGLDEPERPEDDHVEPVLVRDEPLDRADLGRPVAAGAGG